MEGIIGICDKCKKEISIFIGQIAFDGELRWSLSYNCPYCGDCIEMDDVGFPPNHVREALMSLYGKWGLSVNESKEKKVKIISIIRKAFRLSIGEVGKLIKQLPGVILTGTEAEMKWLNYLLEEEGLNAKVVKII
ncbi:MAG: hypothetical protein JNM06_04775 [Blastocatellia bacterium]|nr:hypothetical protein [Blastocatellia bacterium]